MDSIIKASFWTDTRVEEQTAEIKLACLWLISNPSRDICGFTKVSNRRFTFETGLPESTLEGASKGLPTSIQHLTGGVWFMVNFLRHQFGKGGRLSLGNKVVIAAARHAAKLPEELRRAFFEAYPELVEIAPNHPQKAPEKNPPSIPLTVKREGVREGEGEREGERKEGCGEKPSRMPDVLTIVHAYPRRQDDAEALECVRASIRKGVAPETILAGTRAIAAIIPQLPSGHLNAFVVSAGTFFRKEKWRDDPQTWLRNSGTKNGSMPKPINLGGRREGPPISSFKDENAKF